MIHDDNVEEDGVNRNDQEGVMQESLFTVEGTITNVTLIDTSKTIRVNRLKMHMYLKTVDSSQEDLLFYKRPVLKSDKQLRVGQRVSITARKNVISESLEIIQIEPL
jgi:uncharacterized protein YabE (DUF348 family)